MLRNHTHKIHSHQQVSIFDIASLHPGSVFQSMLEYANWLGTCDISEFAKRLTRLRGNKFQQAVESLIRVPRHAR